MDALVKLVVKLVVKQVTWESDRDASVDGKHWLEFQLKPRVAIKMFGLIVRADTAKYCPRTLITSVGQCGDSLKSIGQAEFLDLPIDKHVLLPLISKPTIASVLRVQIGDEHLGDNCRVYGVCVQLMAPGEQSVQYPMCGRVVDHAAAGSEEAKWLVATSSGSMRWLKSQQLKPLGPTFPQCVSLRDMHLTSLSSAAELRGVGVGMFPLQALEHLCLAGNQLTCLPDDLATG